MHKNYFKIEIGGKSYSGFFFKSENFIDLHLSSGNFRISLPSQRKSRSATSHTEGGLTAPMPGKVVKIFSQVGDSVKKGEVLLILEAMKMEHKIIASQDGVIQKILFQEGDRISQGVDLIEMK